MTIIPVSEFAPDMPDMPAAASDKIFNVVPATPTSYGPQRSLGAYANAISARCQGAFSAVDDVGDFRVFAGDVSKLYRMSAGAVAFSDVSKVGGYTTAAETQWNMTQFGTRVIATNYNDPPQSYVEGTSTLFEDLIATGLTTLKAKYCAVVRDFLVLANTTDGTYGTRPQRVHWSAINDPTNFPTPATTAAANALSDFQDIVGTHGHIKGIIGNLGTADGAVFFERAVYRMAFAGMPTVFNIYPVEGALGLISPGGLTQYGGLAFYVTEDGIKMFDGSNSKPIGKNKIDRFFYTELDSTYLDRISSAVDPSRGLIFFAYPAAGSGGVCNRVLIYNLSLDRWTATETDDVRLQILVRGATFGRTLEDLDSFGTLETLAYPLDSQAWIGGRDRLAGFDTDNRFGYFDGVNLAARVESSEFEQIPGKQTLVNYVRPIVDTADCTLAMAARDRIQDAPTYGAYTPLHRTGLVGVRSRGRYHRVSIKVPAGSEWNHISGFDVEDARPLGAF